MYVLHIVRAEGLTGPRSALLCSSGRRYSYRVWNDKTETANNLAKTAEHLQPLNSLESLLAVLFQTTYILRSFLFRFFTHFLSMPPFDVLSQPLLLHHLLDSFLSWGVKATSSCPMSTTMLWRDWMRERKREQSTIRSERET